MVVVMMMMIMMMVMMLTMMIVTFSMTQANSPLSFSLSLVSVPLLRIILTIDADATYQNE